MRWEPDVSRGDWLQPRLEDESTRRWTMPRMVPRGFQRYARIFHRIRPTGSPRDASPIPWHEVAAAHGAITHPLMAWDEIVLDHTPAVHRDPLPTTDDFDGPEFGRLEEDELSAIAVHLAAHTTTPDTGVAAVWDGWGGLFARQQGRSWSRLSIGRKRRSAAPHQGVPLHGLDDTVFLGPRLHLPHRDHVLFDAGVREFTGPWTTRAPWVFDLDVPSPSLLWPEDRAWVLVSDTDWSRRSSAGRSS